MEYHISLRKGEDGHYVAQCLEVPGAISQGKTRKAALTNCKEALQVLLEVLREETKSADVVAVKVNA